MRFIMLTMIVFSVVAMSSIATSEETQRVGEGGDAAITDCDGVLVFIDGRDRLKVDGKKVKLAKLPMVLSDRIAVESPDCIKVGVDGLAGIRTILNVMEVARVAVAEASLDIPFEVVPMPQ